MDGKSDSNCSGKKGLLKGTSLCSGKFTGFTWDGGWEPKRFQGCRQRRVSVAATCAGLVGRRRRRSRRHLWSGRREPRRRRSRWEGRSTCLTGSGKKNYKVVSEVRKIRNGLLIHHYQLLIMFFIIILTLSPPLSLGVSEVLILFAAVNLSNLGGSSRSE